MDWVLRRYPAYTLDRLLRADAHELMQLRALLDPEPRAGPLMADNKVAIDVSSNAKSAAGDVKGLRNQFDDMAKSSVKNIAGVGLVAGAAAGGIGLIASAADTAAQAVVQFGLDSINKASDLRESMSLTQQVFEDNTGAVEEWAKAKDDAFSETEALNFASEFGTAFKNVGQSIDDATDHAETFTKLAGDLGSAFNRSSEEAATALRSGLLGESEPLRAFGVFLDEAKVKAKAAAMGMKPLNGALTDGQKVAARYALIMEQTADSQGMFGRDTGSLADAQKKLSSNIDDLQAKLGTSLIPAMVKVTGVATDMVAGIDEVTRVIDDNKAVIGPLVDALQLLSGQYGYFHMNVDNSAKAEAKAQEIIAGTTKVIKDRQAVGEAYIESLEKTDSATDDVSASTGDWKGHLAGLHDALAHDKEGVDNFRDSISKLLIAQGLASEDVGKLKRAYSEAKIELGKDVDKLHELEKIKHPTRDQRLDILRTKDAIQDDRDAAREAATKLYDMGKITFPQLIARLKAIGDHIDDNTQAAREFNDALYAASVSSGQNNRNGRGGGGKPKKNGDGAATGGYRPPGWTGMVGEEGDERLTALPDGGIMVTPHQGGGAQDGGGHTFNFTFNGTGSDVTPAAARRFGVAVMDEVSRGLREQRARGIGRR